MPTADADIAHSLAEAAVYERRQLGRRRGALMALMGGGFFGLLLNELDDLVGREVDLWVIFAFLAVVYGLLIGTLVLKARPSWQPVFNHGPQPTMNQAVGIAIAIGAGLLVLFVALYFFDDLDRFPAFIGAVMAAAMTGTLFAMSRQQNDGILRAYSFVSIVWPALLLLGVLPQDFTFTWIVIGYAVPLLCLGILRMIAPE